MKNKRENNKKNIKENNRQLKRNLENVKVFIETICKYCNSYKEVVESLNYYFINIADDKLPNFDEITKTIIL